MKSARLRRMTILAGTPLLMTCALSACSKQEKGDVLYDVTPEGGPQSSGGGAFSTFQSRIRGGSRIQDEVRSPPTYASIQGAVPMAPAAAPQDIVQNQNPVIVQDGMTAVQGAPVSTFSVDVDTASYSRGRGAILSGGRPDPSTVRVEEMINYFRYDLPRPTDARRPFSVTTDVVRSPWHPDRLVMRVGLRGYDVTRPQRLPANLVFLIDVSGSMDAADRLPLVQRAMASLSDEIGPRDRVSIVAYSGSAKVVLEPTSDRTRVKEAISELTAGGSTSGGAGLRLAYQQARAGFVRGGINRVIIASDGDFNVGESDPASLRALISSERRSGVTLSTLGVGQGTNGDGNMEALADAGDGNSSFLGDDAEARKVLHDELTSTLQVIAKDVKAQVEFNPAFVSSYRLIGYDNRRLAEREFDDDSVDAGDIGAGHQVTALYEIQPAPGMISDVASRRRYEANRTAPAEIAPASADGEAMFVKLRYKLPTGGQSQLVEQAVDASSLSRAPAATGDTAFALSVASFGRYLKADPALGAFGPGDMQRLAGSQRDPIRQEFIALLSRLPGGVSVDTLPPAIESVPASAGISDPVVTESPDDVRNGWIEILPWLALLSGIAASLWHLLRRMRAHPNGPTSSDGIAAAEKESEPVGERLSEIVRQARGESTEAETDRSLLDLSRVGERAKTAAGADPDIAVEVRTILDRHLPAFVEEYLHGRRRASVPRAAQLEEGLRRTIELLTQRLRDLLDSQSQRDVDRLTDHERFLSGRHVVDPAE